jgi:hypothetical protein
MAKAKIAATPDDPFGLAHIRDLRITLAGGIKKKRAWSIRDSMYMQLV